MLMFRDVPWPVNWRFGIFGGPDIEDGSPPSTLRVRVAVSLTVMLSRSRVAVNVAAKPTVLTSPVIKIPNIGDSNLRIDASCKCCPGYWLGASFSLAGRHNGQLARRFV